MSINTKLSGVLNAVITNNPLSYGVIVAPGDRSEVFELVGHLIALEKSTNVEFTRYANGDIYVKADPWREVSGPHSDADGLTTMVVKWRTGMTQNGAGLYVRDIFHKLAERDKS